MHKWAKAAGKPLSRSGYVLTGFDVPSMAAMYIDKPMKGHNLMQTIARVNRVYKDEKAGLIVDYIGMAAELWSALSQYTKRGQDKIPDLGQGILSLSIQPLKNPLYRFLPVKRSSK